MEIDEELVAEIQSAPPNTVLKPRTKNGFQEDRELVDYIQNREMPESSDADTMTFRASSIGFCLRMQWYGYMTKDRRDDFDFVTGAADHGNYIHDMVKRKLMKAGLWRGDEIYVADRKLNFTGHIDMIIFYNNELAVVEIKSMNSFKYVRYLNSPDHHHRLQLQSYLMMKKINTGYILPYSKNTDKWTLLKTGVNKDEQKEILNRLKLLRYYTSNNIKPERIAIKPKDNKECGWCNYRDRCWRE